MTEPPVEPGDPGEPDKIPDSSLDEADMEVEPDVELLEPAPPADDWSDEEPELEDG
ncbi:hypothetical protein ACIQC5_17770 [Paenarthrobacter sp. NPDC092416]|uniref:hypothetical protein n=1 Tax=Paenarthrobacter sp. NPDC092416 TaxID=3364386 RepID=UPI003814AADF